MMKVTAITVLFMLLVSSTLAQRLKNASPDDMLTVVEKKAIGFDKLTSEEQENLRLILVDSYDRAYKAGHQKGVEDAIEYMQGKLISPSVIETQIEDDFEGWDGETVVKLLNGQIWEQTEYYYEYHYSFMPNVLIYKSGLSYKMRVDGIAKAVGVVRLK